MLFSSILLFNARKLGKQIGLANLDQLSLRLILVDVGVYGGLVIPYGAKNPVARSCLRSSVQRQECENENAVGVPARISAQRTDNLFPFQIK